MIGDVGGCAATDTLTPLQRVILRVTRDWGASAYRTQLVKLIYFLDYIYYRHQGRTLTGIRYAWDLHGPNALRNEIVHEADSLASKGLLHMAPQINVYGDYSYLYRTEGDVERPTFDPLAEEILDDVLAKYRGRTAKSMADASKRTAPFANAVRGQVLDFGKPLGDLRQLAAHIVSSTEAQASNEPPKTLTELRTKYGLA